MILAAHVEAFVKGAGLAVAVYMAAKKKRAIPSEVSSDTSDGRNRLMISFLLQSEGKLNTSVLWLWTFVKRRIIMVLEILRKRGNPYVNI